ncbi:MAG: tetratricopeptide repeat protein [Flavobacteriales bacterium]|nr:tetratricopeptide repeat protein [Flavobacteriales bacterium]MCB9190566.1 tetratricopeptide repeat protein [Flavobacteriales bacterium]
MFLFGCDQAPKDDTASVEIPEVTEEFPGQVKLDSLTALLEKDPNNTDLLNERAMVFLDVDQTNFALADVGKALLLDSTIAKYYLTISDVYFRLNKPNKCKNALLKAVELQPDYKEPLYRLAQFELYLRNYQESINYANDMLRIDARDDRPFMLKGLCYKELGDTTKAIENLLEAVTQNPDNYDAFVELGILNYSQKNPLAEGYLKSALAIRPEGIDALYALGMYYQGADKLNEALETYTRIIEIDSTYSSAYFNMGYVQYQYLQLYNEALANFDKAVKVSPKYYQAVYMRGLCYEAKGDMTRAKREYAYALELNPNYGKAADGMKRIISKN